MIRKQVRRNINKNSNILSRVRIERRSSKCEGAMDYLFEEWRSGIELDDIRGLINTMDLRDAVERELYDRMSDDDIWDYVKDNTSILEDSKVLDHCDDVLHSYIASVRDEYDIDDYEDEDEMEEDIRDAYEEVFEYAEDVSSGNIDGDEIYDIVEEYGHVPSVISMVRDEVIAQKASDMSWNEMCDELGLTDLTGDSLADALNEYDLVDYGRLYEEFEDITDNDEYWYDRKREIEDDEEADESRIRRVVRRIR